MPISAARVERILSMVDGVVLLVDAAEGPLPQTKFVLGKALRLGLKPIVLINKVDRSDARPHQVHDEVFDLFSAMEASDEQLDFPTLFASARQGWAATSLEAEHKDMEPLFDLILRHVPSPKIEEDPAFRMLVTTLESDAFLGRILTGRILSGTVKPNTTIKALSRDGRELEQTRITKVLAFRGLERMSLDQAEAGDIVAVAGLKIATVADTIGDLTISEPIPSQPVDPPTLAMTFSVNDSPLAGTRRRQGHDPHDPRAADARGRGQRRDPRARYRERRLLRGCRPRRIAARRADRNHAPRGLSSSPSDARASCSRPTRRPASAWSRSRRS